MATDVPGWEGSVGPFRSDYGRPHVYARDVHSGAGNCVCGAHLGHSRHVQAAPGVDVPDSMRSEECLRLCGRGNGKALPKLLVLARSYSEARDQAALQGLREGSWRHARGPEDLRGYGDARVWPTGRWESAWSTSQLEELRATMHSLRMEWITERDLGPWRVIR